MESRRYLTLEKRPDGAILRLEPEALEEIRWYKDSWSSFHLFIHLFEDFTANGWYMLTPEDIGALTGCDIIVSDDVTMDDRGIVTHLGDTYWHANYQVQNPIEALLEGELFLHKVQP